MPGNIDAANLKRYVTELEALEADRKTAAREERAKMREAQRAGFSPDGIRIILRDRKMPPDVREAQIRMIAEYRAIAADFATTPLGQAAAVRETVLEWPRKTFAEQSVGGRTRRPRKMIFDADTPAGRDSA